MKRKIHGGWTKHVRSAKYIESQKQSLLNSFWLLDVVTLSDGNFSSLSIPSHANDFWKVDKYFVFASFTAPPETMPWGGVLASYNERSTVPMTGLIGYEPPVLSGAFAELIPLVAHDLGVVLPDRLHFEAGDDFYVRLTGGGSLYLVTDISVKLVPYQISRL